MRKFSPTLIFCIVALNCFASHTPSEAFHKGCHFGISPLLDGSNLTMTTGFYGEDCGSNQTETEVFFGNGDNMSWVTETEPSTHAYFYNAPGDYTAEVWLNGIYESSFPVHIVDTSPCDSTITCFPAFVAQLFYSEQNKDYSLRAVRTDTCSQGNLYWAIGGIKTVADTLDWPFAKIEEGSMVNLCLHLQLNCGDTAVADTASCEQILINQQNATLIDPIPDHTIQLLVYPTMVENEIHITAKNFSSTIMVSIYSLDGRKILDIPLVPAASESSFTIDTENFPGGIYLVEATNKNQFYLLQKIFKQ
jgi:hypothetical protein